MQRHWKILQWITSGWNCRGGFSVSLRRDEGCIYLCFLLRPVGFCFSKILHLCHLGVTKSACPTDAEKCPPTAICPYSRWRSQPLSRVSRKQRYNTLDFPTENRVPRWTLSPLDTPAKGNAVSLWIPYANRDASRPYWKPRAKGLHPSGHRIFSSKMVPKL